MLYAHRTQKFQNLSKALESYKIESGIIDIAMEYLDISKNRNNTLLDKIPVQSYLKDWGKYYNLEKAVQREILSVKNHELIERYILLSQALYGNDSYDFIRIVYAKTSKNDDEETITKALSSRYGDKAEACYYAIYLSYCKDSKILSTNKSPQICLDAIEFVKDPAVIAILCAKALNQIPVPEKMSLMEKVVFSKIIKSHTENNVIVNKLIECVKGLISPTKPFGTRLLLAVGEGAYFSDELKKYFIKYITAYRVSVAENAIDKLQNPKRILNLIAEVPECMTSSYISSLSEKYDIEKDYLKEYFRMLAVKHTEEYIKAMNEVSDIKKSSQMENIRVDSNPEYKHMKNNLKEKTQIRLAKDFSAVFGTHKKEVHDYINGNLDFSDIADYIDVNMSSTTAGYFKGYISAYGRDEFIKRVITVMAFMKSWGVFYFIRTYVDFDIEENTEQFTEILIEQVADGEIILERIGEMIDTSYVSDRLIIEFSKAIAKHIKIFADVDVKQMSVTSRCLYLMSLATADRNKYKKQILSVAGDTSKKVKETLTATVSVEWREDIIELLKSKKSTFRELAISVIEKNNDGTYKEELEKAFEKEKSDKLKTRIAGLIGLSITENSVSENKTSVNIVASLAKGAKAKKVAWLFEQPYKMVNFKDGEKVPEDYLKTLIILYSDMPSIAINNTAVEIAEKIDPDDLNNFAVEVFRRWVGKGATAKTKWVMWFCGVHGGHSMIETLMKYIKEWSENSRGAIASEAVYAMAVNGSSEALLNVDSMARKFKHRQVRNSANDALVKASELLGITKEELSDRIVPDMGFNEQMCRVFDYGKRQFNVYLTPTLEIEIYNGDKKVKNMPKVGANDDKAIAEKSYNDFKVMKKQIKTVIENQKQRLEYVLMCDRKWNCEDWKKLFVKNPVMHCFAIGLIWGIYNGSELIESFRYMDDGSFTNIEEDEFEIPENSSIGLVHPIELTDEQKNTWIEQLSDYEITQPFNQLTRPCYKPTEKELNSDEITRFEGVSIGSYTLRGKLTKQGWETGEPMDAGFFEEFVRNDVIKCTKNSDGTTVYDGYHTEIAFDGMCIDYMEAEDVHLGKLIFKNYNSRYYTNNLKIKDVNLRYFSEIIMQLSSFGNTEDKGV